MPTNPRRGSVLIFVLATVLVITSVALLSHTTNRARLQSTSLADEGASARSQALAHAELIAHLFAQDPTGFAWRTDPEVSWKLTSPDGKASWSALITDPTLSDLTASSATPVRVRATAADGRALSTYQWDLTPTLARFPSLDHALVVRGSAPVLGLIRDISGTQSVNQPMARPSDFAWDKDTAPFVVAGATGLLIPDDDLITHWRSRATEIAYSSIPSGTIAARLLSPAHNPFGSVNTNGVYAIDCKGNTLVIKASRIVGTLIIIDPGSNSRIEDSVLLEAHGAQPALLVAGNFHFDMESDDLTEASRNMNPTGAPFRGKFDSDTSDLYPSCISGVVFIKGNLQVTNAVVHGNLIVDGNLTGSGTLRVDHNPPPDIPGLLLATQMRIVPGTFQRITN